MHPRVLQGLTRLGFFGDPDRATLPVTIVPVSACDLACPYCIQNTGPPERLAARPPRIPARSMSEGILEATIEFLRRRMEARSQLTLDLTIFGGEPLIRPDLCLSLLRRCQALGLRHAQMITNGVRLNGRLGEALYDAGLRRAQVTLDGDRLEHDQVRVAPGGTPTFDRILDGLVDVQGTGLEFLLRVNVTALNRGSLLPLVERLHQRLAPSRFHLYFAPVDDIGVGFQNVASCDERDVELWCDLYQAAHAAGFQIRPNSQGECEFCAHRSPQSGVVINADGQIYSCWDAVGRSALSLGDVKQGYVSEEECTARWVRCGFAVSEQSDRRPFWQHVNDYIIDLLIAKHCARKAESAAGEEPRSGAGAHPAC